MIDHAVPPETPAFEVQYRRTTPRPAPNYVRAYEGFEALNKIQIQRRRKDIGAACLHKTAVCLRRTASAAERISVFATLSAYMLDFYLSVWPPITPWPVVYLAIYRDNPTFSVNFTHIVIERLPR